MTILEKLKAENKTILEKQINDQYLVFVEGLDKKGCATDKVEEVDHVIVQLNSKIWINEFDYVEDLKITENTQWEDLTEEFVQAQVGYGI